MDLFNIKKLKEAERKINSYQIDLMNADISINNYKLAIEDRNKVINEKEKAISGLNLSLVSSESYIEELKNDNRILSLKLESTEKSRRKSASSIGGYVTRVKNLNIMNKSKDETITKLNDELTKSNKKIIWLENNQRAPSLEEIKAYDLQQKEVEKRQAKANKEMRARKEEQLTIDTVKVG